jgi:hypothetical protein
VVIYFDALHDTQLGLVQFSIPNPLWIIPNRWKLTVEQGENKYEKHTDLQ